MHQRVTDKQTPSASLSRVVNVAIMLISHDSGACTGQSVFSVQSNATYSDDP